MNAPKSDDVPPLQLTETLLDAINEEELSTSQLTEEAFNESEEFDEPCEFLRGPTEEEIRQIEERLSAQSPQSEESLPQSPPSDRFAVLRRGYGFEWYLTRFGATAYAFQIELDEVGAVILAKFATKEAFDAYRKTIIRSSILKGFPVEVQNLINSPEAKDPKQWGNARVKAMGKLNRVIRGLRRHCYGDDGDDDNDIILSPKRDSKASKGDNVTPLKSTKDGKKYPFFMDFLL